VKSFKALNSLQLIIELMVATVVVEVVGGAGVDLS
jgi:hypothetical protein